MDWSPLTASAGPIRSFPPTPLPPKSHRHRWMNRLYGGRPSLAVGSVVFACNYGYGREWFGGILRWLAGGRVCIRTINRCWPFPARSMRPTNQPQAGLLWGQAEMNFIEDWGSKGPIIGVLGYHAVSSLIVRLLMDLGLKFIWWMMMIELIDEIWIIDDETVTEQLRRKSTLLNNRWKFLSYIWQACGGSIRTHSLAYLLIPTLVLFLKKVIIFKKKKKKNFLHDSCIEASSAKQIPIIFWCRFSFFFSCWSTLLCPSLVTIKRFLRVIFGSKLIQSL